MSRLFVCIIFGFLATTIFAMKKQLDGHESCDLIKEPYSNFTEYELLKYSLLINIFESKDTVDLSKFLPKEICQMILRTAYALEFIDSIKILNIDQQEILAEFSRRGRDAWVSLDGKHTIKSRERESNWRYYTIVAYKYAGGDEEAGTDNRAGDWPNAVCSRGIVFGCTLQKDSEKNAWFWRTGWRRFGATLLKPALIEAYQKEISNEKKALAHRSLVSYLESVDIIEVISINNSETLILCKIRNKDGSFGYAKFNIDFL